MESKVKAKDMSPAQVADELGVQRGTVLKWVKAGVLPSYRIGVIIRIPAAALEQLREKALSEVAARK